MKANTTLQTKVAIVLPNQLFKEPAFSKNSTIYLVEEFLFFRQYRFHQQKIAFHRATMKFYEKHLLELGYNVEYIESASKWSKLSDLLAHFTSIKVTTLQIYKPVDNWIEKDIRKYRIRFDLIWFENPLFINTEAELIDYFQTDKKSYHQTDFYIQQRKKLKILTHGTQAQGGQWSFDEDNRKKYPKDKQPPPVIFPDINHFFKEAVNYTLKNFGENYGKLSKSPLYPTTYEEAESWFDDFLNSRFHEFGIYEDAIVKEEHILNHSILSPLLNVGLLNPKTVISKALKFSQKHQIPINSIEGFVRQIIGWREFVRGVYEQVGTKQRNSNFFEHKEPIPKSFYTATTGINPIDTTIKKLLDRAYVHHIERLMLLANFMNLCGINPNSIYQWFMEMFIDAYDWVMVPNVYGMSLFADGGLMSTKPYVSSSNYVSKMSNYGKGDWKAIWDALFWNFLDKNYDFFVKQPRLSMLIRNLDKLSKEEKNRKLSIASDFLKKLHR